MATIAPGLSTLLICLAVVGIAIAVVSWMVVGNDGGQDATDRIKTARVEAAPAPARPAVERALAVPVVEYDSTSFWRRLRSGAFLVVLLAVAGALTALIVLVAGALVL